MNNRTLKNSKLRCTRYRKKILEISQTVPALHIGGAFSSVEIIDCIFSLLKKKKISSYYQKAMLVFCNM